MQGAQAELCYQTPLVPQGVLSPRHGAASGRAAAGPTAHCTLLGSAQPAAKGENLGDVH